MRKMQFIFNVTTPVPTKAGIVDGLNKLDGVNSYLSTDTSTINISVPADTSDDDLLKIGAAIALNEVSGYIGQWVEKVGAEVEVK